jgi:hypothetical protein
MPNRENADIVQQYGRSSGVFIAGRQDFSQHQLNDRKIIGEEEFVLSAMCCLHKPAVLSIFKHCQENNKMMTVMQSCLCLRNLTNAQIQNK